MQPRDYRVAKPIVLSFTVLAVAVSVVFLPLQDQIFPDEQHFGGTFYQQSRLSAAGLPQIAGPCSKLSKSSERPKPPRLVRAKRT